MAETAVTANNIVKRWENKFFTEYVRDGRFRPYMGTDEFSMIQIKEALQGQTGRDLSITLINRLTGTGSTGKSTLKGNEEAMDQRTFVFAVDRLRHAVLHDGLDEEFSAIDLVKAKNSVLRTWFVEKMRDEIIEQLGSINGVAFGSADASARNAWLADNADRVLFGSAVSNASSGNHATSLGNIDNTADKLTGSVVSLAKRRAKLASPKIRPIKVSGDEEWYVCFAGSLAFRDFAADSAVQQANRDAWTRGKDNPLFTGGDLVWDGVIVREVPEIDDYYGPLLSTAGAGGSVAVAPSFLCGAQALGVCWKKRSRMIQDVDDYGAKKGAGFEEIRDIKKLLFGKGTSDRDDLVDHGVHTIYTAAVADA